jgi:hypothetical protein
LVYYKSYIIIQKNIQNKVSILLIYTSMFIIKSFKIIIVIIVYFDLEIKYFDIINIFINILRGENIKYIIYQLFPGYKQPKKVVKINRVLYNVKDSFSLWYKDFFTILKKIGLKLYPEKFYIYITSVNFFPVARIQIRRWRRWPVAGPSLASLILY